MNNKNKVLVTGANGLLGSNLVFHLVKKGYRVIALVRKGSNRKALQDIDCEIYEGDVSNIFNNLEEVVRGCSYVIHCAAKTKQYPVKLDNYIQANIISTVFLIMLCKKVDIKRFVFISSAGCFENGTIQNPGDETGSFMNWQRESGYIYSKYLAQQMVIAEAKNDDFPAVVLAPTYMIGARDAKPSSGQLLLYTLKNRILFYPPGGKSFVDVDHVAEAAVNALSKGRTGEVYLLSGENLSYKDFMKKTITINNKRQLLVPIPKWILHCAAGISGFLERVFKIYLPLNRVNCRLLCLDNFYSNAKARIELEMKPTIIENSIKKARQWFKDNNYLA